MRRTERLLVASSLAAGLFYPLLWAYALPGALLIAAKGAGVGLLALAAAVSARRPDGGLLAAVMALGAAGDVLLEIDFAAGAAAFAFGHVVAISLYARNRRPGAGPAAWAVAALLPVVAAALPALLLRGRPEAVAFTLYALLLGAMAAAAWLSRFPRDFVALGAFLFLASDMLIAFRLSLEAKPPLLGIAIWLLYYFGQLLIFLGVRHALAEPYSSPS